MKNWIIYPKKTNNIIDQILINRNIKDKDNFLNPDYEKDIHNPNLFRDMAKAVKRIKKAIEKKEKIAIFADYDADGIPGAAILNKTLSKIGVNPDIYIPTREEGYGLNEQGINYLKKNNCKLIITVDLGISGKKEVEYAKSVGIDVIVTDHHIIQEKLLPINAVAIIHPDLKDQQYPNKSLSGGAVAWKLATAFLHNHYDKDQEKKVNNYLKWLLDLSAISIICDMVPLVGENRVIVKYGLIVLKKTKNIGLKKLYEESNIDTEKMNTYTVGFQIGPRINAPGRLDHASASFCLLTEEDVKIASEIAVKLNQINLKRQQELTRVFKEAKHKIENKKLHNNKIMIVKGRNWPDGIIGLVAGRLTETFSRPVIILAETDEKLKGSARSIDSFHLLEALEKCQKYLTTFGGHAKAAGLSLEKKHLEALSIKLENIANEKIDEDDMVPKLKVDTEIDASNIKMELIDELEKLEPHGIGNPKPLFLTKKLLISDKRLIGSKKNHLKLKLFSDKNSNILYDAVGFDLSNLYDKLKVGEKIDIVYYLDRNIWNNRESISLKILDIKYDQK